MISRSGNRNFFAAHYDWLVLLAGVAVLALGAAVYVLSLGQDPDAAAAEKVADVERLKPSACGVSAVDMTERQAAVRLGQNPLQTLEVSAKDESFLASERRVLCGNKECRKAIPGDVKACPACPYCGTKQLVAAKVVVDADNDGLPDEWEKKYGLTPADPADADVDTDKDDFTNAEEFAAKTDPTDRKDHPDYLDSLQLQLPLKQVYLPFVFVKATKIPAGWRCEFFDPKQKDNYNRMGRTYRVAIDEEIGKSGFVLKACEQKSVAVAIKGGKNMTKQEDASEVKVERKSDGKVLTLTVARKNSKPVPVDVKAALSYSRGGGKQMDVAAGDEIELSGTKYKIKAIESLEKGAKVVVENVISGKIRTLEALEP